MVTAPVSEMSKYIPSSENEHQSKYQPWIQLIHPRLYMDEEEKGLRDLYLTCRIVSEKPQPSWPLLILLCNSNQRYFSSLLFTQMGAFVPTGKEFAGLGSRCGLSACTQTCIGAAESNWPELVLQGVLWCLLFTDENSYQPITKAFQSLLEKLTPESWEALNRNNVWNQIRPVWVSAVSSLLQPFLSPAVEDIIRSMGNGISSSLNKIPKARGLLIKSLISLEESIPVSLVGFLFSIEEFSPSNCTPLCGSIVLHFIFTSIYTTINTLIHLYRNQGIEEGKLEFLQGLNENICCLNSTPELEQLLNSMKSRLLSGDSKDDDSDSGTGLSDVEETFSDEMLLIKYECVAAEILQERSSLLPLTALYRFVCYNSTWINWNLGFQESESSPPKMKPWNSSPQPDRSPLHMINFVGSNEISGLINLRVPWNDWITSCLSTRKPVHVNLFSLRPAFFPSEREFLHPDEVQEQDRIKEILENM
ncbi:uncharacterized protein LOC111695881 [Eurytemora carolleeae]|uniref:uncharacterized protein LOC111695881 n=1 Tax=Eurytemora carolleeae TaxID=1294199 RepID=UPI000C765082|nr:uncharacterized protein LOC111695881 [Eurytemora carolleeae]|eukprot:XP_023321115.1 uncharacterized protein LOC111695881 [Eurytemora affinis]